jgi:hypothetical protein
MKVRIMVHGKHIRDMMINNKSKKGHNSIKMKVKVRVMVLGIHTRDMMMDKGSKFQSCSVSSMGVVRLYTSLHANFYLKF